MLFNNLTYWIFRLVLWIMRFISNLIIAPFYFTLQNSGLFPNLSDYTSYITTFLNDYVLQGLAFVKEVFLNITGYPRPLFHILVNTILIGYIALGLSKVFIFFLNLWKGFRNGE